MSPRRVLQRVVPASVGVMGVACLGALVTACNAVWGIDGLDYDRGGSGAVGATGGTGGAAGAHTGLTGTGTSVGGWSPTTSSGSGASAAGPTGGSGGDPCAAPCNTPPNSECYEPTGTCDPQTGGCSYTMLANGTTCASTTCGDWDTCDWDGPCSNSGSRSRTCTDYTCQTGTCTPSQRQDPGDCSRTVANGTSCSGGYCCSQSCVARNNVHHCGSCGIDCGSDDCVELHGTANQYSCTCYSTQICKSLGFGSAATCWDDGVQMVCNCQCSSGSSCTGQCAGGGICQMVSGHNYCHY